MGAITQIFSHTFSKTEFLIKDKTPLPTQTVSPCDKPHTGDPVQTNPPRQVPPIVSLCHPIYRAGFAWGCGDKLYRLLHNRTTSSAATEQYFFPKLEDLAFVSD